MPRLMDDKLEAKHCVTNMVAPQFRFVKSPEKLALNRTFGFSVGLVIAVSFLFQVLIPTLHASISNPNGCKPDDFAQIGKFYWW